MTDAPPLRVALDGRYIQDHFPGIGRYTAALALALARSAPSDTRLVALTDPARPNRRHPLTALDAAGVRLRPTPAHPMSAGEQLRVPWLVRQLRADIFHVPHCFLPALVPCRAIVNVHDVTPRLVPEMLPSPVARLLWATSVRHALSRAARVVTLSEAARADLVREFGADPARVTVVPAGVDPRFRPVGPAEAAAVRARYGLPERYVLSVGTNKPHKNLARLIDAFGLLPSRIDAALVVAGTREARFAADAEAASRLPANRRLVRLGAVDEADLPALYAGAAVFAFPSRNEGFGLPALEAMAAGAPVVVAAVPPLLEVVGDAGLAAPPDDTGALRNALATVLGDPACAADLSRRGRARAAGYTWESAAARTWQLYREVARR